MANDVTYIGKMDHRIQFVKLVKTKGSTGAEVKTESIVATVWSEKKTAASDKVLDEKVVAMNVVQWMIRWHPDIVSENVQSLIIRNGTDEFEIYGVEEIGRRQFLRVKTQYRE